MLRVVIGGIVICFFLAASPVYAKPSFYLWLAEFTFENCHGVNGGGARCRIPHDPQHRRVSVEFPKDPETLAYPALGYFPLSPNEAPKPGPKPLTDPEMKKLAYLETNCVRHGKLICSRSTAFARSPLSSNGQIKVLVYTVVFGAFQETPKEPKRLRSILKEQTTQEMKNIPPHLVPLLESTRVVTRVAGATFEGVAIGLVELLSALVVLDAFHVLDHNPPETSDATLLLATIGLNQGKTLSVHAFSDQDEDTNIVWEPTFDDNIPEIFFSEGDPGEKCQIDSLVPPEFQALWTSDQRMLFPLTPCTVSIFTSKGDFVASADFEGCNVNGPPPRTVEKRFIGFPETNWIPQSTQVSHAVLVARRCKEIQNINIYATEGLAGKFMLPDAQGKYFLLETGLRTLASSGVPPMVLTFHYPWEL